MSSLVKFWSLSEIKSREGPHVCKKLSPVLFLCCMWPTSMAFTRQEHRVAVCLAGCMRSVSMCRSAHDKTFQLVRGWLRWGTAHGILYLWMGIKGSALYLHWKIGCTSYTIPHGWCMLPFLLDYYSCWGLYHAWNIKEYIKHKISMLCLCSCYCYSMFSV